MMNPEHKKILDEWWATEPFGWDHPDTYDGITDVVEKCVEKIEAENERLNKCIENDMLVNIEEYMLCPDSKLSPMAIEHKRDIITAVKKLLKEHNETETE